MSDPSKTSDVVNFFLVGDGSVGKTSIIRRFIKGIYSENQAPTIFDNDSKEIIVDGVKKLAIINDMAGQSEYASLRQSIYKSNIVILLVYSVDSVTSYENAKGIWVKEIKSSPSKKCPIFLVANKVDLRSELQNSKNIVTTQMGQELAKKLKAVKYFEVSAKDSSGVEDMFFDAARLSENYDHEGKKFNFSNKCNFL